jgi:hypothetical protein
MDFDTFLNRRPLRQAGYAWEVEQDATDSELAVNDM